VASSIFIAPDGTVQGLHSTYLDDIKETLGLTKIERASTVEFDNELQQWVATIISSGETETFHSKRQALWWEEGKINERLRNETS
jgi:hypothetical protein